MSNDKSYQFAVVGPQGVGKTTLVHKYLNKSEPRTAPIGGTLHTGQVTWAGKKQDVRIWDVAGGPNGFLQMGCEGADAIALCYDASAESPLEGLTAIIGEIREVAPSAPIVLVGLKQLSIATHQVTGEEVMSFVTKNQLAGHVEADAKGDLNVTTVFETLAEKAAEKRAAENPAAVDKEDATPESGTTYGGTKDSTTVNTASESTSNSLLTTLLGRTVFLVGSVGAGVGIGFGVKALAAATLIAVTLVAPWIIAIAAVTVGFVGAVLIGADSAYKYKTGSENGLLTQAAYGTFNGFKQCGSAVQAVVCPTSTNSEEAPTLSQ